MIVRTSLGARVELASNEFGKESTPTVETLGMQTA